MNGTTNLPTAVSQTPRYISWEITHRCDARCVHCYACAGPDAETASDLSTAEALAVIDQLAAAGRPMLAISGGEPLLRDDWRQLVRYAIASRLVVTVVTNGSTIGESQADELRELGVESVTVSLDSHRPEVHDEIRQLPGLHARARAAILRLVARGVRVVVNFTPMKRNRRDLRGVVDLAHQLRASAVSLSEYVPVGRGDPGLALAPQDLRQLLAQWAELKESYRGRLTLAAGDRTVAMLATGDRGPECPDCGAGSVAARIGPDGTVTPCAFLSLPIGSFRREAFADLWPRGRLVQSARLRAGQAGDSCARCGMMLREQDPERQDR